MAGDTAREASSDEVKQLRTEARQLKEALAEVTLENRLLKKSVIADGEASMRSTPLGWRMRYAASEKLEIIRTVETSHLPVRRTLDKIAIPKTTFYAWLDRYAAGGFDALEDRKPRPKRVWKRISDEVRNKVIERVLEEPELSPREVAVAFPDAEKTFVSEASVYRIHKKAEGLVTSPAFIVVKAADAFANPTTAINERRVADAPPARSDRLHVPQSHRPRRKACFQHDGWFYLSTVLDDVSRYIVAWKLCATMTAIDVTATASTRESTSRHCVSSHRQPSSSRLRRLRSAPSRESRLQLTH